MPHLEKQFEAIATDPRSSLRILINPNLSDFFFWHFHPELELVYIENDEGPRHVGHHQSTYRKSDLVLIGSNIPHLNFDYGAKSPCRKVVVHMAQDFLQEARNHTPELQSIHRLFEMARYGIAFDPAIHSRIGKKLKLLGEQSYFQQFLTILDVLHDLTAPDAGTTLHDKPYQTTVGVRDHDRLTRIYSYVEQYYQQKITNDEIAELCSMTKEAFCRYFKKMTRLTFTEFVNQYRIDKAKQLLMQRGTVSEACYATGFDSLSYFTRTFRRHTGRTPRHFKEQQ